MKHEAPEASPPPLLERFSPRLVASIKEYTGRHNAEVEAMVRGGGPLAGEPAGKRLAQVYDGLLSSLFHAVRAAMSAAGRWQPATLAGVGTYGRGTLAPHSDLDVRLICAGTGEQASGIVEALLYPLWDARLTIGYQVVDPDEVIELARTDIPTATSLLDWRFVVGDHPSEGLTARVFEGVFDLANIGEFLQRLEERAEARHERFGGSVYLLEPDVKNGPGGLRDLDVAHWAARARWKIRSFRELVRAGVLVPHEWQQMAQANDFLWRIRNLLHVHARRRSDRLTFDLQEALTKDLGYGEGDRAIERFMSDYYRQARIVVRFRDLILRQCAPPPRRPARSVRLGNGLKVTGEAMSIDHPSALDRQPALALRLYHEAILRGLPIYGFARDAIVRVAGYPDWCQRLRGSPEAADLFRRLVTSTARAPFKHSNVVKELHDVGLLVAMIPEFAPVVGRVHHDIYHVLTVDAHSVAAVERLATLARGELAAEYPLASRLAAEIARPNVLFFAVLLHDVGKDVGGRNHSLRGARLARGILERLGLPEAEVVEVQHLIAIHLSMYHVATRRDLDDPKTQESFAKELRGRECLRELYLLTVCDVSTTSPSAMTSWKARMLDDLYVVADRVLLEGAEARDRASTELIRAEVRRAWGDAERAFLESFLSAMPERYLYANTVADIVKQARFAVAFPVDAGVAILSQDRSYYEVAFVADDRPGLLAMITATLAAARLEVAGAQIYSWAPGSGPARALDVFWVRAGTQATDPEVTVRRLQRDFDRVLRGEVSPMALSGTGKPRALAPRQAPRVKTEITVDNRVATNHTVVEIATHDRFGLLFGLASALQQVGVTIELAKINTEGDRVADVFYVADVNGAKLTDARRVDALKDAILETIGRWETG